MEWGDRVQLHFGDMRTLELPEKVDILITELLGSFGDNELSPECLDGAVRFLKRERMRDPPYSPSLIFASANGISIPSSYTAHIAPLSSTKLFNEVRGHEDLKKSETPYVVMFNAINILGGEGGDGNTGPRIQECWEFAHPAKNVVLNERGGKIKKFPSALNDRN
jgi:protein arginine N-methyltransferase 5